MMLDEILAEQQFRQVRDADRTRMAMEFEARAMHRGEPGLRTAIAGAFVTIGGWLDHRAIDRAAAPARRERGMS
jgi:hypothetical protein